LSIRNRSWRRSSSKAINRARSTTRST
jgi:hypothetical protein